MADLIPHRLIPGDTVGVIAPSDPVLPKQENNLQMGVQYLQAMGFQVKCGAHIHANTLGYAATPGEKADDINHMFADPKVKAIICAQGGNTANAPLTLINWDVVQRNPKIFLGLSDITVLLNAIYHRTGLVTFHGNDILWGFGNNLVEYERSEFIRTLIDAKIGFIPAHGGRMTIRGGQGSGKLLGGNLHCLLKLAGTPYWPDFTGAILFLEAYEISASACHTAFLQLQHMGVFDQIHGAVVGYIYSMQHNNEPRPHMEDVLLEVTRDNHFPILKMNDFGHVCPNTVLPVGGEVFLDATILSLELLTPVVQ
ncbi:MAG: LD-carboxypeptidase [Brevefilum sp.]|nr:LD-carboxypeptidase [Brevefilum sp.]